MSGKKLQEENRALSRYAPLSGSVFAGSWFVGFADGGEYTGENPIDVYEHPIKGLCVFAEEYIGREVDVEFTNDGHIPVGSCGLKFLKQNDLVQPRLD